MGTWLNQDGLFVQYGQTKTVANTGGEYVTTGALREIEFVIDLTTLTEVEVVQSDTVFFPKMRVHEVEIITQTAAATGTAIDIGLVRSDRTTEIDFNGFVAAFVTATMDAAGETVILRPSVTVPTGVTGTGALVGTTTTLPGYVTASRTTATAFTAGVIRVKIRYYAI